MADIVERVARAMADAAELVWDSLSEKHDIVCGHGMPEGCRQYWRDLARAGIPAMKYDDADEGVLIEVSNTKRIEAISLAEAWDDMIEAHLNA